MHDFDCKSCFHHEYQTTKQIQHTIKDQGHNFVMYWMQGPAEAKHKHNHTTPRYRTPQLYLASPKAPLYLVTQHQMTRRGGKSSSSDDISTSSRSRNSNSSSRHNRRYTGTSVNQPHKLGDSRIAVRIIVRAIEVLDTLAAGVSVTEVVHKW